MNVEFSSQPKNAKVWVYQSNEALGETEKEKIFEIGYFFLDQWESHNLPVKGSIEVLHDRFIVVSAFSDEDSMCGRAQDAQMRLIKELEEVIDRKLTDRMLVFYEEDEQVKSFHFSELSELLAANKITSETIVFNSQVNSKETFEKEWKGALKDTWLSRFV